MVRVIDEARWRVRLHCTGEGNGDNGCGRFLEVEQGDLFNSNTITRPFLAFECPACGAWSDLPGYILWPPGREGGSYPERRRES